LLSITKFVIVVSRLLKTISYINNIKSQNKLKLFAFAVANSQLPILAIVKKPLDWGFCLIDWF